MAVGTLTDSHRGAHRSAGRPRPPARAPVRPEEAAPLGARPAAARRALRDSAWARGKVALTAVLAAALWLASVEARGFGFTADSMSYAALARRFDAGRWFTSGILAWGMAPGRFRSEWPPLYPAVLAALHALGPALPWCQFAVSGVGFVAAAAFGALAVREACGELPWVAVAVLAGFPAGLYVAGQGWSEPLCLALLGLHFWQAARAARRATAGGAPPGPWAFFPQALAAGLAFLDRYAAAAFIPAAVALPAVLLWRRAGDEAAGRRERRQPAASRGRALRGAAVAALGAALPVVPWAVACLAITGKIGTHYPPAAAGVAGVLAMLVQGLSAAGAALVAGGGASIGRAALIGLGAAVAAGGVGGAALARLVRARGGRRRALGAAPAPRPAPARAAAGLLLAVDAVASAALVLGLRVVLRFDPVHLRLLTPTLYAAGLAVLVGLSYVPWREVRGGLLLPVGLLALWHGGAWTAAAIRAPAVPSTLRGPWCRPGPQGDCAMLAWLRGHTTRADLIAGNAAFTVNFALHRTTEEIEAPPVDPVLTAPVLRTWAANWDAAHPGGVVFLALDTAAASMGGTGPLLGALWANPNTALPGLALTEVASGPSYRVWLVLPNDAVPVLGPG